MKLSFPKLAGGLALVLCSSLSLADSTGAGAVTSVSFTLIDLDPNDGVTPAITFAAASDGYAGPYVSGYVRAATADGDIYREFTYVGGSPLSNVSGSASTPVSNASGSVTGAAGLGFSALSVSGSALSGVDFTGVYFATINGPDAQFTLSANTQVIFTVTGWLSGQTTHGGNPDLGAVEDGGANLVLQTSGPDANGNTLHDSAQASAVAWYTTAEDGTVSGETKSWQGQLASSYSNTTLGEVDGHFMTVLSVGGTSTLTTAVPEPASYALILSGLAIIGGVFRRRRAL